MLIVLIIIAHDAFTPKKHVDVLTFCLRFGCESEPMMPWKRHKRVFFFANEREKKDTDIGA